MRGLIIICGAVGLGGCATVPAVQYNTIASPADMRGMADSFYLRRTTLEISATETAKKDAAGENVVVTNVAVKAVPAEYRNTRYAIGGKRTLRSDTRINLTKIDNTDLISAIGTETTDTTVNTINQAGGVIAKLISLATLFAAAPETPCLSEKSGKLRFDLDPSQGSQNFDGQTQGCIRVDYGPLPQDAIPVSQLPLRTDTRFYYFAACREAAVRIAQTGTRMIEEKVKVSDPTHLQYARLPNKGTITHHSSCGISVVTEKSPTTNPADIVGALEAQGKAISDAIEAAKKDDDD
ncbi:hypothetical protein [Parasphingorhabdus sp.]|uniref:hypothetical protein n=1 Tax=Parasphingorhabdus sp. TaxID=2709688 RepID=UPI003A90FB6D